MKPYLVIGLLHCALAAGATAATRWIEEFEGPFPADGWIENSVDQNSTYAFNGSFSAKFGATADSLITPLISAAETLIFWTYTTSADPSIVIETSASANGPWTACPESPINGYTQQWNGQFIDLTGREDLYVRFSKNGTGSLYIDDIQLEDGIVTTGPPVLSPIGNSSVIENTPLVFTVTAIETDGDPATLSAEMLPPGATFSSTGPCGLFEWNAATPAGIYTSTFYAVDQDGIDRETITISVEKSPAVFISEIADPAGTGGGEFRFVELYNAGNKPVDLSGWTLRKQINGGSWSEAALTNSIAADSAYVIAFSAPDFFDAYQTIPDLESNLISGNGDDGYFLYKGEVQIDSFGEMDTDGTDSPWDYEDSRAERKVDILKPRPDWIANEWILTEAATTNAMTPGIHGPIPQFEDLSAPFAFSGNDLTLTVTAVNNVRTDVITLYATELPPGAVFESITAANRVSSTLHWAAPPEGTYTATLCAAGSCGTNTTQINITISDRAAIDGTFAGWKRGTIVKLDNGQFWQNRGGVGPRLNPPLRNPEITVTNHLAIQQRMIVDGLPGSTEVEQIYPIESLVTNGFTGLHIDNIYELADGTTWKQISFENIPSADPVAAAWRMAQTILFVNKNHMETGRCTVEAAQPPPDPVLQTKIRGLFYGFRKGSFFHLENGSWWRQSSLDKSTCTLRNPAVSLWTENGTDFLNIPGAHLTVEITPLSIQTESIITNTFCGLHHGEIYQLENSEQWMQISFENIGQTASRPVAVIWTQNEDLFLLIRNEFDRTIGTCQIASPSADTDRDGTKNADETIAGSNPLDDQSNFVITGIGMDKLGRTTLHWEPTEGRVYTIEWTPALDRPFSTIDAGIHWPQQCWTNTIGVEGFYRITVQPE